MERLWTCNVSISNGSIKCPIGKSIFTVNLPLKLFRGTVANADAGSLEFLYTLFDTYLDHMLTEFEPNRMVQSVQNLICLTKKKTGLLKPFWKRFRRHFARLK